MNNDQMQVAIFEMIAIGCLVVFVGAIAVHLIPFYIVTRLWANVSPEDREEAIKWFFFGVFIAVAIGVYNNRDIFSIAVLCAVSGSLALIQYSWRNLFGVPKPIAQQHERIVDRQDDYSEFDDMSDRDDYSDFDQIGGQDDFVAAFDKQVEEEQAEAAKQEQHRLAQDDFAAAFDERKATPPPPKKLGIKLPTGVEYRQPKDDNNWARVDDPSSAKNERLSSLRAIIGREARRAEKPSKRIFKVAPYGIDKRHSDDKSLWLVVDNYQASDGDRISALRKIINKEDRRAGRTNPNVEYIRAG